MIDDYYRYTAETLSGVKLIEIKGDASHHYQNATKLQTFSASNLIFAEPTMMSVRWTLNYFWLLKQREKLSENNQSW